MCWGLPWPRSRSPRARCLCGLVVDSGKHSPCLQEKGVIRRSVVSSHRSRPNRCASGCQHTPNQPWRWCLLCCQKCAPLWALGLGHSPGGVWHLRCVTASCKPGGGWLAGVLGTVSCAARHVEGLSQPRWHPAGSTWNLRTTRSRARGLEGWGWPGGRRRPRQGPQVAPREQE